MVDVLTPQQRRKNMASIRNRDTKPERLVRSLIHKMGFRFKLSPRDLPGKPDIVLPKHEKIIFVHGCFWHMHNCRYGRVAPATNSKFWCEKRMGNKLRDKKNLRALRHLGWRVFVAWECQLRDLDKLQERLGTFLGFQKN